MVRPRAGHPDIPRMGRGRQAPAGVDASQARPAKRGRNVTQIDGT